MREGEKEGKRKREREEGKEEGSEDEGGRERGEIDKNNELVARNKLLTGVTVKVLMEYSARFSTSLRVT